MKELKQYSIKTDFSTYQNISAIYIYFPNSVDQLNNSVSRKICNSLNAVFFGHEYFRE